MATVWLVVVAIVVAAWTWRGNAEYRVFRALEDSGARQRYFYKWTAESFVVLVGMALASLLVAGAPLWSLVVPDALAPAAATVARSGLVLSSDAVQGMLIGMALATVAAAVVQWRRRRATPVIGDIAPMLPRNRAEMLAAVPLAINAGVSEELFFRCALPVLLVQVTGSVAVAVAVATIAFGLAHVYQGWAGVAATTVVGAMLFGVYLASGSLLHAMVIHAAIDLVALVVRPAIGWWIERVRGPAPGVAA